MREGMRVIDADRHVIEPMGMWREYLPAAFREQAPYYAALGEGVPPMMCVDGEPLMNLSDSAYRMVAEAAAARAETLYAAQTPQAHLDAMDRDGIDAAVLFPTYGAYLVGVDDMAPALAQAYALAYNDWLRDFCSLAPDRLIPVGLMPRHDPKHMLEEARRVCRAGWRTLVVRPNPIAGRTLGHADYAPFWAFCAEQALAVVVHEGTHSRTLAAGADRFTSRFSMHACSHPMEQMMAFLSLLEGGVLDRHPSLKVAFLEAGCGWLPYWLWRLDEVEYRHLAPELEGRVRMPPSAYFRRQCLVGVEPDEPLIAQVIEHVGAQALMFGTDFPHLDHDEDILEAVLAGWRHLPRETLRLMLGGNAEAFYQLPSP